MANTKQAKKRALQGERNRKRNAGARSMMRTYIKAVRAAITEGNVDNAKSAFLVAQAALDKAARKGLIHLNQSSRLKTRLNKQIKALAA